MTRGFSHFDNAHRENFSAGLILLCLEASPRFRDAFCALVRRPAGLPGAGRLVDHGREHALEDTPDARRSDLWLRFDDGVLLVELKTHSRWDPAGVTAQMRDQHAASLRGERVRGAVLLAPGALLRSLPAAPFCRVAWGDFFAAVDALDDPGEVVRLAIAHWSEHVERDFGLPSSAPMLPLAATTAQTGCLVALLRTAFLRLDGAPRGDTVWFSSADGRPRQKPPWAWFGLAVRGEVPGLGDSYFGIYTYTAGPPDATLGTFLEAYRTGDDDTPRVSIPFAPTDLSSDTLHAILGAFVAACQVAVAQARVSAK